MISKGGDLKLRTVISTEDGKDRKEELCLQSKKICTGGSSQLSFKVKCGRQGR